MKTRLFLIIIGVVLLAGASIARLINSDFLRGSSFEIAVTLGLVVIGLVAIGYYALTAVKKKLIYVQQARTKYQAAYMCMIEADPINTYMLVATDTELKVLTNDKKQTPIMELKKEYVTVSLSDTMLRGIRKVKGLTISTNGKAAESLDGQSASTNIILLDDAKLMTPPLKEEAVAKAVAKLS